jgi:hypothetical protein
MKRANHPRQSRGKADATLFRLAKNVCLRKGAGLVDGYYDTGGNVTSNAWWGFWLASNIVVKLGDHVATAWVGIFRSGLTVIAACLAIAIVRDINSRQEERHKRLMAASQPQFWSQPHSASGAAPNVT